MTDKSSIIQLGSRPVRCRLISPEGHRFGIYDTALEAASAAGGFWPGVGQKDDDREGWDIEAIAGDSIPSRASHYS